MGAPELEKKPARRRVPVLAGIAVAVALGWGISTNLGDDEPADAPEVCATTEYEGCPARWEYLWADGG